MKIYDISQEVFGCAVFPGDPAPEREIIMSIAGGDVCNVTVLRMCAHNGTHMDAPYHFIDGGKTVDRLDPRSFADWAYVAGPSGPVGADDAERILAEARGLRPEAALRILIRGRATLTEAAASVFAGAGVLLYGNESQTVGPEDAPRATHLILLGAGTVLLEGVRLGEVPDGAYFLCAAPLNLGGADGAPCRAMLFDLSQEDE